MSAIPTHFAPGGKTAPSQTAYVIPLAKARFVIKAQYFNPLKKADMPLPDHAFLMFDLSSARVPPVLGEPSQADGVSWILFEDDLRVDTPESEWAFTYRPLFKQADGSMKPDGATQKLAEVFIDLEQNTWVSPEKVGFVDRRKLLRLPLWASFLKAKQGGFKEAPPGTNFATSGVLRTAKNELKAFGDQKKQWLIQIDHNYFRSFVRFHYYDVKAKQRQPLPRGVLVTALGVRASSIGPTGADPRARVAAGTALDDQGTVYLLHERSKAGSAAVHYYFATGIRGGTTHGIVDFSIPAPAAGAEDTRIQVVSTDANPRPDARYVLPVEWHSHGMQAWVEEDANGFPKRKGFKELRVSDTTQQKPLCFHLDDAVLAAGDVDLVQLPKDARIALFDHLLHLRDVDPRKPHLWKTTLKKNYLPAEDAVYVNQQGVERLTRLAYLDGIFYHLLDGRLGVIAAEKLGSVTAVGARAFIANQNDGRHKFISYMSGHPTMPDFAGQKSATGTGRSEFLLIDASYLNHNFTTSSGALSMKLMHLLVHIPLKIDGAKVTKAAIDAMLPALTHSAERWDQSHPGHPGEPAANTIPRTLGLVPVGGAKAQDKVVLVRHYFGESATHPDVITLHVRNSNDRGFASPKNKELTVFVGDIDVRNGGVQEEPAQAANTTRATLAHELGHIMGQPDEYNEDVDGFPKWDQYTVEGVPGRPYSLDAPAMMCGNNQPRLRHLWNYHNRLRAEADFKKLLDGKDYVAVDAGVAGGLDSELPFVTAAVLGDESNKGPYTPVAPFSFVDPSTRRSELILYRLPRDEGTVRKMFFGPGGTTGTLAAADRFDGMALILIRYLCDFEPALNTPVFHSIALAQLEGLTLSTPTGTTKVFGTRFFLAPDPAPPADPKQPPVLRRIAIAVAAQFDVVARYTSPATPPPNREHISIRFVGSRPGPHPLLSATPPTPLPLTFAEIDDSLLCYALGATPTVTSGTTTSVKTTITAADFSKLASQVGKLLKDPAGFKRQVKPL